jgi:uncharacterized OB-fold protein
MSNAAAFAGGYAVNLGPSVEGFLLPAFDEEAAPFWEATKQGRLVIQACGSCGRLRHPPRPMCPSCHSTKRVWKETGHTGTVWSYVVPHPPLLEPYSSLAPYNVIVVELDHDPRIRFVGNLVEDVDAPLDSTDPSTIRIGQPVEMVFRTLSRADGSTEALPFWVHRRS